jgi:hypothetical protein
MKQKLLVTCSILFLLLTGKGNNRIQPIHKGSLIHKNTTSAGIKTGGSVLKFASPFFKYL